MLQPVSATKGGFPDESSNQIVFDFEEITHAVPRHASHATSPRHSGAPPQWPSYNGTAQYVGTSPSGKVIVYNMGQNLVWRGRDGPQFRNNRSLQLV